MKAKSCGCQATSDFQVRDKKIIFNVTSKTEKEYDVEIAEIPSCTCIAFTALRKNKCTCKHIVWVLMEYFAIQETNAILAQVSFTSNEIEFLYNQRNRNTHGNQKQRRGSTASTQQESNTTLTSAEKRAIFEKAKPTSQKWYAEKLITRKEAKCCTCGSTMPEGKMYIYVSGFYIPPRQLFAVQRMFYLCAMVSCVEKKHHT